MARMDRAAKPDGPVVQGFESGGFAVDGRVYRALLLTPESAREWEKPALAEAGLELVLGFSPAPEFLLLGTGPSHAVPPRALVRAIEARGIGVEAMDSRAAARAWGLLRGEQRWIVAALMPLG
ncbi:MAG: Mth938-like domain-containing protein [Allosphingosinicella sp.]